jgi:glycosyltransferase involved in cell wall biosynthesis
LKSILFFIESLEGGGAEGALANLVGAIDKSKFDIHVVSVTDNEFHTDTIKANSSYRSFTRKSPTGSRAKGLFNKAVIKLSLSAPPALVRKALIKGKYDIEVAFCEGYSTKIIGASKDKKSRKIAWVHTDLINNPWSEAMHGGARAEKECYKNFDAVVCVSQTIKDSFVKKYGMEEKTRVIYNVLNDKDIFKKAEEPFDFEPEKRPLLVLAGGLRKVKGFDRMVRVCARLRDEGYVFSAIILGGGSERGDIESLIDEHDLRRTISLLGFQDNPCKFMSKADVFVCSSRAEGYSTVVTEAVLLGIPVVTTECSGMREIFGEAECGIICENSEEGLYGALKKVLSEPGLLKRFGKESKKRAADFKSEVQIKAVEKFFEETQANAAEDKI